VNARAFEVWRAQAPAMAWLESLAHAIEDGRLVPSPAIPETGYIELHEQVGARCGVLLPTLHRSLGTVPGARVVEGAA